MIYDKASESYLGQAEDMTHKTVDGFLIDEDIHCVYHLDTEEQYTVSHSLIEVKGNMDKFLFTPFSVLASKLSKD